jgi:5-methylcytosine-specific restriction endonuclease McrA
MAKIDRQKVLDKHNGHCGYCGNEITLKEMQVDHIIPKWNKILHKDNLEKINDFNNLMPTCRRCNHYKRGDTLEQFREKMKTLDERIKNGYINKVAIDFGIIVLTKFDGVFYFEKENL